MKSAISMLGLCLSLLSFAAAGATYEIKCNQAFMNDAEERICASPALMTLDRELGELARRVEGATPSLASDQRRFRRALKTCKKDVACLEGSYNNRLIELRQIVNTLPMATETEIAELSAEAEEARAEREAQADAREILQARQEAQAPKEVSAPDPQPVVESAPLDLAVEQAEAPALIQESAGPSVPVPEQDISIIWIPVSVVLLVLWLWIRHLVREARKKRQCPKCSNFDTAEVIDRDENAYTDYKTRDVKTVRRSNTGQVTSTSSRPVQFKVRVVETTDHVRCRICGYEWNKVYVSRSS